MSAEEQKPTAQAQPQQNAAEETTQQQQHQHQQPQQQHQQQQETEQQENPLKKKVLSTLKSLFGCIMKEAGKQGGKLAVEEIKQQTQDAKDGAATTTTTITAEPAN